MKQMWWEDPEGRAFLRHAQESLSPKVEDSAIAITIWGGEVDPKIAIETGYIVLLDKPLIAFVKPGTKIPRKLAAVVDRFIECDDPSDPKCREALVKAMQELGLSEDDASP